MLKIAVILGSTRPNRKGGQVADWVMGQVADRADAEFDLIDLRDHPLPFLDEPIPPSAGRYQHEHTKRWSELIASYDAYVVVTGEYNHAIPAVLKNAFDYLYSEWNNKAIGFVSYGAVGGARAVEQLRLVSGELQLADVRMAVHISTITDFENRREFRPQPFHSEALDGMLGQLIAWGGALAGLRAQSGSA